MRTSATVTIVAALMLAVCSVAEGAEPPTVALLPFENISGNVQGTRLIMPVLERALRNRGYRVVSSERLEPFLARHRIRDASRLLSRTHLDGLRREFGVDIAMVGTVAIFNHSPENPQWGLSARLLAADSGAIVWAQSAGLTGDDFTVALGLGTVTSAARLAEETVKALLHDLPRAGEALTLPSGGRGLLSRLLGPKATYRSPTLDSDPPRRVAVLLFENLSERKGASRIVTDVFINALVRSGRYEVVAPGTVYDALLALDAAPFGTVDFATLAGLRQRIAADALILGTVFTYSEGLKQTATTSPEVAFDARMLDTKSGRILWLAEQMRNGDDSQIALHFGRIRAIVPLILKIVGGMVDTL